MTKTVNFVAENLAVILTVISLVFKIVLMKLSRILTHDTEFNLACN